MKYSFCSLLVFSLFVTTSVEASPRYPWESQSCTELRQSDGKKIGALCSRADHDLQVGTFEIYYFGYLFEAKNEYVGFYANLSLENSGFTLRGLKLITAGDGNNLPKREVLFGKYIVTSHFAPAFPEGKGFRLYFQAQERYPKHNPPFSYDSNLEKNYVGKVPKILY